MRLPSFSKLELAEKCQYAWLGNVPWPKRTSSSFASFGTAVSSAAECLAVWGDAPVDAIAAANDLTSADTNRFRLATEHLKELLDEEASVDTWRKAEVALAIDMTTGKARELPTSHARDYSAAAPSEWFGTPDLVRCVAGKLVVRDYKTGRSTIGKRPEELLQLCALGLAAARAYGFDEVTIELAQVDEGGVWLLATDLDAIDLDDHHSRLADLWYALHNTANAYPRPGLHCKEGYCPILAQCPATQDAMAMVVHESKPRLPIVPEIQNEEHARYVLERLPALEEALKAVKDAVREFASKTPVHMGDGRIYACVEQTRRSIDLGAPGSVDALRAVLGDEEATAALDISTTMSAIKQAAKRVAPKGKALALERELMARLEELGAVKESTFAKFELTKQKENAA